MQAPSPELQGEIPTSCQLLLWRDYNTGLFWLLDAHNLSLVGGLKYDISVMGSSSRSKIASNSARVRGRDTCVDMFVVH